MKEEKGKSNALRNLLKEKNVSSFPPLIPDAKHKDKKRANARDTGGTRTTSVEVLLLLIFRLAVVGARKCKLVIGTDIINPVDKLT